MIANLTDAKILLAEEEDRLARLNESIGKDDSVTMMAWRQGLANSVARLRKRVAEMEKQRGGSV